MPFCPVALYEICSRYREVGQTARQPWSWWRPVLSGKPETEETRRQEYRFFMRDVLKPALAEVNAVTDLVVELVESRSGRCISDLQFKVSLRDLGIDELTAGQLQAEHGTELMQTCTEMLDRRLASAYPEPLREPARYLRTVLAAERTRRFGAAMAGDSPASPERAEQKRQARWHEEWLRRRREHVVSDLSALPPAEQDRLAQALLADMETRRVHPTIRIGEGWDRPTPAQLLEIAGQVGDE